MPYLDRLMDNARVKLPGALDGAIHLELFNAFDDICRSVGAYVATVNVALTAGVQTYPVTAPAGAVPVTFIRLAHETYPAGNSRVSPSLALVVLLDPVTAQHAATPLTVEMAWAPDPQDQPADWVPATLWPRVYNVLLDGVLAAMMAQSAKPYSNNQLALFHARKFRHGKSRLKRETATGMIPGGVAWRFPAFA